MLEATSRPNLLLIMCDQLTASVLSVYGGPVFTPNLERLAGDGVVFTNAVCPGPFCSPSRASIVTGLYPHCHGIVHNVFRRDYPAIESPEGEQGINADDVTTDRLLSACGYETHHYGKWHLLDQDLPYYRDMYTEHGEYARQMSDRFAAVRHQPPRSWLDWYGWALPVQQWDPFRAAVDAVGDKWDGAPYRDFIARMGKLELPLEECFDFRVASRTVRALSQASERPLSITCSFNWPHDPNVVPAPYYDQFDPEALALPENFEQRATRFENDWGRRIVADLGETGVREFLRIYYATIRLVDDQVGRILDELDRTGLATDTLVVFTADHGDMAGGHGMVWKSTDALYDEIVRVPLVVRWPGKVVPHVCSADVSLVDLMPTFLQAAGEPVPQACQGRSLIPLFEAEGTQPPRFVFCERIRARPDHTRHVGEGASAGFMIRGGGWKYCRYSDGEEMLFDLNADPGEVDNLAAHRAAGEQLSLLRNELSNWLTATGWPGERRP